MVKIKDIEPKVSIFKELEVLVPNCKLFMFANGSDLDELYIFKCGNRYTLEGFVSSKIAKYIKMLYVDSWDSAFDLFNSADNIMLSMGSDKEVVTTKEYEYNDTVNDSMSVPSFDSEEPNLDNLNEKNLNHKVIIDKTTVGSIDKDISKFSVSYEFLMKNWIDDIVFRDVNMLITLEVHN